MRDREEIEREIYNAREDLEESLAALKHVVRDKVNVKARARVALERGKAKAQEVLERGKNSAQDLAAKSKDSAIDLYVDGKTFVRERPVLAGAMAGGIIALGALAYVGRQRHWW